MKVTKEQQLRKIIREALEEAMADEPIRMVPGDSFDAKTLSQQKPGQTKPQREFRDTIVMSPTADSVLVGGKETHPDEVVEVYEDIAGQAMGYGDAAKLEAMLKKQVASGYVEIPISWSPSTGWKF